ncbi:MAG: histidine phosphatase family protein, partial [Quisquiliibacterium sp.]
PGARIAAVTHGGVLDCAYRIATGLGIREPRQHDLLNASINRIGFDGQRFSLVGWADVAHLSQAQDAIEGD